MRAKGILESLMNYCLDTFGDLFSVSAFTNLLKSNNLPVSKKTVSNYLQYLRDAFFVILNDKFDFSPRKRLMNPKKLYLLDLSFGSLATLFSENRGKYLENIVAIELYRRGDEMYYYKQRNECDFIIKKGTKPYTAIQVCWELHLIKQKREVRGLAEAMQQLKIKQGIILTYNQDSELKVNNQIVQVLPVWKWLITDLQG